MKLTEKNIIDYRISPDSPFQGLLIPIKWDDRENLRQQILENQEIVEKIRELCEDYAIIPEDEAQSFAFDLYRILGVNK